MKKIVVVLSLILLCFVSTNSVAQSPYWVTADNGAQMLVNPNTSPSPLSVPGSSLTTLFASDNSFAGNMFDVTVLSASNVIINSFYINIRVGDSPTCQVDVYYRAGSYTGHESSPAGWILAGSVTGVVPQGLNYQTFIDIPDFTLQPGQTYGFYIAVDYPNARMNYTNGSNVYEDAYLRIATGIGKGNPNFTGSTFDSRTWNGTIIYNSKPVPFPFWAVVIFFSLAVIAIFIRKRFF